MSLRPAVPHLVLVAVIAAAILWFSLHRDQLDLPALDSRLSALGPWAAAAYLVLYIVGTGLTP